MKLACEAVVPGLGCDFVAEGASADEVHAAMIAHGGQAHSDLLADVAPEDVPAKVAEMEAHIQRLITANN